jgi:hypothetical protein
MLKKTEEGGFINGFWVGHTIYEGLLISHLADDTILGGGKCRESHKLKEETIALSNYEDQSVGFTKPQGSDCNFPNFFPGFV